MVCRSQRAADLPGLAADNLSPHIIDPWTTGSGAFIRSLNEFQFKTRIDRALGLPAWAMFDCAESTGAVIGFASDLDKSARQPLSMVAATPTLEKGAWHFYALCTHEPALIVPTLKLAVELIRPDTISAVLAYSDESFGPYLGLGSTQLLTVWTPAHTEPASATIRVTPGKQAPVGGKRMKLNSRSRHELIGLQSDIENGAHWRAVSPPDESGILVAENPDGGRR